MKRVSLTLTGEPKSTQTCYKYRCAGRFVQGYMDAKCKTLKKSYQKQIMTQYTGTPLKTPLKAVLALWHGTKRLSDIDNFNKLVLDSLTGLVYEDDSQIIELAIRKRYDKANPRVEIEITEYGDKVAEMSSDLVD